MTERPFETTAVDLETAIETMVNLGEKDPLDIARKLINRFGDTWARTEVAAHAEEFITDLARRRLGSVRRSAELALVPGDEVSASHMRIAKLWIPGEGWKVAAELTSSDLRARAKWYHVFSHAARRREAWCLEVASMMDAEGAETLGKLQASLPALPDDEELLELTG